MPIILESHRNKEGPADMARRKDCIKNFLSGLTEWSQQGDPGVREGSQVLC